MKAYPGSETGDRKSIPASRKEGVGKQGSFGKQRRKSPWCVASAVIFSLIAGGLVSSLSPGDSRADPKTPSPPPAAGKTDSTGQEIRMTEVTAKIETGKIAIPLNVVREKKLVRFEYTANGVRVPILSYITPSGKVITAVSVCEPCRSTRFHIKDSSMVCNACFAEWDLETLKGIKGGCLKYPPDVIPNKVEKGQILIEEKLVIQWRPRG